ncbi:trypsin-like peptidase domain-containing protein [Aeromonas sobria]|uniref:trypsin-like peptidase domain-containing protein n=1 Tax=Aeromonas sobria TaxID=646 RepID=UPI000C6D3700|nr:trypsin-like peptidase domain-containing protein [Aeromonas sobria]PKQ74028.1 hypothetical protein CJF47_14315 [Aeromonas sobria]
MNQEEWNNMCKDVVEKMTLHVKPFASPISKVVSSEHGEHLGSGSFISCDSSKYIITNEHVAKGLESTSLAHQFLDSDSIVRIVNPICAKEYPLDVAVSKISDCAWAACQHSAQGIPLSRFANKHQPVNAELLFMIGYSGDRAGFYFGNFISRGTPYLTQEADFPSNIGNENYHFSIHYKPDLASVVDGSSGGLPKPPGMSGSLVWNTRFVEMSQAGKEWSPEDAQVTGLIWGWPSSDACLLATKVEHLSIQDLIDTANEIA